MRDVSRPVGFHVVPAEQAGPVRYTAELVVAPGDFEITRPANIGRSRRG